MKQRQLILSSVLLIVILVVINQYAPKRSADTGVIAPVELRSDGAVNPLAASATPLLTWQVSSTKRGEQPTAWQVRVASSEELLSKDTADLWDSKKINAGDLPSLRYEGQALKAGARAHWQVRWWGAGKNPSPE